MQQLGKLSLLVACYQIKERRSKNGKGLLVIANPMPVFESVLPSLMTVSIRFLA